MANLPRPKVIGTALLATGAAVSCALAVFFGFMGFTTARWLLMALAVVFGVGGGLAILAWRAAKAGHDGRAFVLGLASGLLPPVQPLTLVGAALVRLAPNDERTSAGD